MILLVLLSQVVTALWAAPCCTGGTLGSALITGDEAELYQVGLNVGSVIGDAPPSGEGLPVFRDSQSLSEAKGILNFSHARLLDGDRLQAGVSIPLQFNWLSQSGINDDGVGVGDVSLSLGYETLPEWEYSLWRPRVFNFVQVVLPTGRSVYDSRSQYGSDISGMGQFQASFGTIALKRWSRWDLAVQGRVGVLLGRDFTGEVSVGDSLGVSGSLSAGFSPMERLRLGAGLSTDYQGSTFTTASGVISQTAPKMVWNGNLNLSLLVGESNAWVLGYQDQTWFGPAWNTTLARTAFLSFAHRVER